MKAKYLKMRRKGYDDNLVVESLINSINCKLKNFCSERKE